MSQEEAPPPPAGLPLGHVEPHAPLLSAPAADQLIYKVMTIENLSHSLAGRYLYFNRVNSYADFPGADHHDGEQLPKDRPGNETAKFEKDPTYSVADYFDQSRHRTYACCFSLENSPYIWSNYGTGSSKGKVCLVFEFGKLRETLNQTLQPGSAVLDYKGIRCHQIFSINYGNVRYVDWIDFQANGPRLANPIEYAYLKDKAFGSEKELRVTLHALGFGHFALADGSIIEFPSSLHMAFDFRRAVADHTIKRILCQPGFDPSLLARAIRYVASNNREDLWPEKKAKAPTWSAIDELFQPKIRTSLTSAKTIVKYKDESLLFTNAFGERERVPGWFVKQRQKGNEPK